MKAVALLSGGLDSVVSMLLGKQELDICLAITIDYGQKARINEIRAAKNICVQHGIEHRLIELSFMKDLKSGLLEGSGMELSSPWVPNRNGLFINLAAAYAENLDAGRVICGFNREEAVDFPDNSSAYIKSLNSSLYFSTLNHVEVVSYVQGMDKLEIIKRAQEMGLDFRSLWSCYVDGIRPCGQCPSCLRNKEAFEKAGINYVEDFIY
ncbi:MAG: 7-cyano-7-deazaguanine synthase QueC [Syntrophomonas sp.]